MNIAQVNIRVLTGSKKIKRRPISFVLGYLRIGDIMKNKNIDGFYTKTTQKGGFSKLCAKIKKDVIPT
jgi:hypothetical protein